MKTKKFFKRLLAVVMALVLSNVFTTVERAEAAECPHGDNETYTTLVYARNLYDKHEVDEITIIYDTDGNVEEVRVERIECTITTVQRYYEKRCIRCNTYKETFIEEDVTHSYSH